MVGGLISSTVFILTVFPATEEQRLRTAAGAIRLERE